MVILLNSLKIIRAETAEGAYCFLSFGGCVPSYGSSSHQDRILQDMGSRG